MDKQEFIDSGLLEMYALGLVDQDEEQVVLDCLEKFPELRSELTQAQAAISNYAKAQLVMAGPAAQNGAGSTISMPTSNLQPSQFRFIPITISILATAIAGFFFFQNSNLRNDLNQSQSIILSNQVECDRRIQSMESSAAILAVIQNTGTQTLALEPLTNDPQNTAQVFYNPSSKDVIINPASLKPLANQEVYQVWADVEGEMVSMGVVASRQGLQSLIFHENSTSINITIEPEGGSDHPTVSRLVASIAV